MARDEYASGTQHRDDEIVAAIGARSGGAFPATAGAAVTILLREVKKGF
jgi:hypothetical protein